MDREEFSADSRHDNVKLLEQLAACCVEIGLTQFEFAARELPQPAVSLVKGPSADQESSIVVNDGRENTQI